MAQSAARRRNAHQNRTLAAELVAALQRLGGAAHRDVVIDRVITARRNAGKLVEETLRIDLARAFERYREQRRKPDVTPLFTLPFGEGSLRWALIDAGSASRSFAVETQVPGRRVRLTA